MSTKRVKIEFGKDKVGTLISGKKIILSNENVKNVMKTVVRAYEIKESKSHQDASKLVLNA